MSALVTWLSTVRNNTALESRQSLHDLRVAARRSRVVLRATGAEFALVGDLARLGRSTGAASDLYSMAELLEQSRVSLPAELAKPVDALVAAVSAKLATELTYLRRDLAQPWFSALLERWQKEVDALDKRPTWVHKRCLARARKLRARLEQRLATELDPPLDHELRLLVKRIRYLEMASGQAGSPERRQRLIALQDSLGARLDRRWAAGYLLHLAKERNALCPDAQLAAAYLAGRLGCDQFPRSPLEVGPVQTRS